MPFEFFVAKTTALLHHQVDRNAQRLGDEFADVDALRRRLHVAAMTAMRTTSSPFIVRPPSSLKYLPQLLDRHWLEKNPIKPDSLGLSKHLHVGGDDVDGQFR